MNAQTPIGADALTFAVGNADMLRAVRDTACQAPADIAHATGRAAKNIGRQVALLLEHGLIARGPAGDVDPFALTDAGAKALLAVDVAEGRVGAASATVSIDPDSGVLLLRHHQLRRNPAQPRKDFDRDGKLQELKASIVADLAMGGPGVLQNLTVFPADEEGVHMIYAGERRWRAVGELIEEGMWPADKPLRALPREPTAGLAAFLALVENGQRQNLSLMEEARGFATLCEETGWSARHAALQAGRDVKTVQQMLQVVRTATPENIARFEDPADAYTWEDLRRSVQTHRDDDEGGEGGRDPNQVDLEEAVTAAPVAFVHFSPTVCAAALAAERARGNGHENSRAAKLSGTTTVEGEVWPADPTEILRTEWTDYPRACIALTESDWGRWSFSLDTQAGGPGFGAQGDATGVWTNDPIFNTREAALQHASARIVRQLGEVWGAKRKLHAWLEKLTAPPQIAGEPAVTETSGGKLWPPVPGGLKVFTFEPIDLTKAKSYALTCVMDCIHGPKGFEGMHGRLSAAVRASAAEDANFKSLVTHGYLHWGETRDGRQYVQLATDAVSACARFAAGELDPDYRPAWLIDGPHVVRGVDYGNATRAAEIRRAEGIDAPLPSANSGGTFKAPAAAGKLDREPNDTERLALLELAWRLRQEPDATGGGGHPLVRVHQYWLDQAASDLRAMKLIDFSHTAPAGGPWAFLTVAGEDWVDDHLEIFESALAQAQLDATPGELHAQRLERGHRFVTPWLNVPADPAAGPGTGAPSRESQLVDAHAEQTAQADLVYDHEGLDEDLLDAVVSALRTHLSKSRGEAGRWHHQTGTSLASAAVVALREGSVIRAVTALMGLLQQGGLGADVLLREAAGDDILWQEARADTDQDAPLFGFWPNDVVSIGGDATGYRLLGVQRDDGGYSGPSFMAQAVRLQSGKDTGKPRTVTLHAIQRVVRRAGE